MNAIQIYKAHPEAGVIGRAAVALPSSGSGLISDLIARQLDSLSAPTPTFSGRRVTESKGLDVQLYDALAGFKMRTALVAMHLDRDWRLRLFGQLDSLLALEDWPADDPPPSMDSFSTFLRMLTLLRPQRRPGLGASSDGHLIATWTVGDDRLTIECLPKDIVRWHLAVTIDDERERAAAETPLPRLGAVLGVWDPTRWFSKCQ